MIVYGGAGGVFLNSLWGVCLRNWNQTFVLVGGVCTYIRGDKVVVGGLFAVILFIFLIIFGCKLSILETLGKVLVDRREVFIEETS